MSSNPDPKARANIADGDHSTQWQSNACFPGHYLSRPTMNPLLRLCEGARLPVYGIHRPEQRN